MNKKSREMCKLAVGDRAGRGGAGTQGRARARRGREEGNEGTISAESAMHHWDLKGHVTSSTEAEAGIVNGLSSLDLCLSNRFILVHPHYHQTLGGSTNLSFKIDATSRIKHVATFDLNKYSTNFDCTCPFNSAEFQMCSLVFQQIGSLKVSALPTM